MRIRILISILLVCFIGKTPASDDAHSYTLYLIRHAEKVQDGNSDPVLTETGKQRSENLADWFSDRQIENIWSSDYKRTRDTAKPIASKLNIDLTIYDPRNLPKLTESLKTNQKNAIVVGHSNTTPELARLLCNCEIADMDEFEHDRVIVVLISDHETWVETQQQR